MRTDERAYGLQAVKAEIKQGRVDGARNMAYAVAHLERIDRSFEALRALRALAYCQKHDRELKLCDHSRGQA